jgi:hypothetical protein
MLITELCSNKKMVFHFFFEKAHISAVSPFCNTHSVTESSQNHRAIPNSRVEA